MKHLFSSGEILAHQNEKSIPEGHFIGETLEYQDIDIHTEYICYGSIDGKPCKLVFTLSCDSYENVKFKMMLGILMQTDVFESEWTEYRVEDDV